MTRSVPVATFALALLAVGCQRTEPKVPVQPTRGTLAYNGKPAVGATLVFHPVPLENNTFRTRKPTARVGADGTYEVNSYDLHDGAKAGEYAITVLWTGEGGGPGPDLLKGKYADPKNPVGLVTISAGQNQLAPIELTGPEIDPSGGPGPKAGPPKR